jgi:hypothetical protein
MRAGAGSILGSSVRMTVDLRFFVRSLKRYPVTAWRAKDQPAVPPPRGRVVLFHAERYSCVAASVSGRVDVMDAELPRENTRRIIALGRRLDAEVERFGAKRDEAGILVALIDHGQAEAFVESPLRDRVGDVEHRVQLGEKDWTAISHWQSRIVSIMPDPPGNALAHQARVLAADGNWDTPESVSTD